MFDPEKPPAEIPLGLILDTQTAEEAAAETLEFFKKSYQPPENPWLAKRDSPRRERPDLELAESFFDQLERDAQARVARATDDFQGRRAQTLEEMLRKSAPADSLVHVLGEENPSGTSESQLDGGVLHKRSEPASLLDRALAGHPDQEFAAQLREAQAAFS